MSIALAFVTAENPCAAQRLIRSARRSLGNIAIYVADQSVEVDAMCAFYDANGVSTRRLSTQVSVAAARNALLREIREDFVLLCEDNFVLGPCSAIGDAMTLLENLTDLGVIGGRLHDIHDAGEHLRNGEECLQLDPRHRSLTIIPVDYFEQAAESVAGIDVYACDAVAGFCILRRSVFMEGNQWDERIRSRGWHEDFFLNLKLNTKWRVVHLPSMAAVSVGPRPADADDWTDFLEKWDVSRFLRVCPTADQVERVKEAAYGDDVSALQAPNDVCAAAEPIGQTPRQAGAASSVFKLHALPRGTSAATAARRMNRTSLRSLLDQAADSVPYDATAAVLHCCYSPLRTGDELLVWCRPQLRGRSRETKRSWFAAAETSGRKPARATLYFRWFESSGQPLVWESEGINVELHGAYWSPLLAPIPVWPSGVPHLRFEIVVESDEDRIPVAVGFLFDERRCENFVRTGKALALTLPSPNAFPNPGPERTVIGLLGDPETPSRLVDFSPAEKASMLKIDLAQSALVDLRALLLVDLQGMGRRLTAVDTLQAGFQLTSCVAIPSSETDCAFALGLLNSGKYCRLELRR